MATFLLAWNPDKWSLREDELEEKAAALHGQIGSWACRTTAIRTGDRVFLSRVGREPRGIFASGRAVSGPYLDNHWDSERSDEQTRYVQIRWNAFLNPTKDPILSRRELEKGVLGRTHWATQSSGIRIPDDIAVALERRWAKFIVKAPARRAAAEASAIEGETKEAKTVHTRAEPDPPGRSPSAGQGSVLPLADGTIRTCLTGAAYGS